MQIPQQSFARRLHTDRQRRFCSPLSSICSALHPRVRHFHPARPRVYFKEDRCCRRGSFPDRFGKTAASCCPLHVSIAATRFYIMQNLSSNAKLLLVIGIVLIILCAIGMVVQWSAYMEFADSKPVTTHGGALQSMISWNHSNRAKADQAMNMFIFMIIGCAAGAACIYGALRRPKPEPQLDPHRYEHDNDLYRPDRRR